MKILAPVDGSELALDAVRYEREIGSGDPASTLIEIAGRYGCEAIILGASRTDRRLT